MLLKRVHPLDSTGFIHCQGIHAIFMLVSAYSQMNVKYEDMCLEMPVLCLFDLRQCE